MLTKNLRVVMACVAIAVASFGLPEMVLAQATPESAQPQLLTEAQVRERYQNCPDGYYSGPRPGKTRYTKDPWVWVVTPEFARRFCMPEQYVSHELKGAEAIAYRLAQDEHEELCTWDGKTETCRKAVGHRFEVYYKNGAIPKARDVSYSQPATLPSRMLLSKSERSFQYSRKREREKSRIGAVMAFHGQQFGLQAIKDGTIIWPLGTLFPEIYFEEVFEGIDYVALQGTSGFSNQTGWHQADAKRMVITVRKDSADNDFRRITTVPLSDFALVIEIPQTLADRVIANDRSRGLDLRKLSKEALQLLEKPASR